MKIILTKELHAAVDAAWHRDSSYQAMADVLFAGYESGFELSEEELASLRVAQQEARGGRVDPTVAWDLVRAVQRAQSTLVPKSAELTPELEQVAKGVYLEWMNTHGSDYGRAVCNAVRAVLAKVSAGKAEQAEQTGAWTADDVHAAAAAISLCWDDRDMVTDDDITTAKAALKAVAHRLTAASPVKAEDYTQAQVNAALCAWFSKDDDDETIAHNRSEYSSDMRAALAAASVPAQWSSDELVAQVNAKDKRIAELEAQLAAMQTEAKAAWREVLLLQDELAPHLAAKPALTVDDVRSALAASAAGANGGAK